jgi:hypothetical protein
MQREECAYAAEQLTAFLKTVGPVEAAWAMNAALETLMERPTGDDHVAAVVTALDESLAEFDEQAQAVAGEPAEDGGEELPPETPEPPAKKSRKAS